MKASAVFKKAGDAGRNAATGDVARALRVEDGRVRVTAPGIYAYADSLDGDWQPLLTAEEWQAQHPLRLRKLGEGEPIKYGHSYLSVHKTSGEHFAYSIRDRSFECYELPDLTADQSEPTCEDGQLPDGPNCPKCGGNRAPSGINGGTWVHTAAPAPNSVGERLTSEPEVGTPVVYFQDGEFTGLFRWTGGFLSNYIAYYRWHGPIPEEPKPEKVEPPKWLGAVRSKDGADVAFVTRAAPIFCVVFSDGSCGSSSIQANEWTLAPDIMPPSPELAALFGEEAHQ